jgi:predicted glycogen debranching enzyme
MLVRARALCTNFNVLNNSMTEPILKIPITDSLEDLISKEWLVTNGLGGYASGTVLGLNTRRFHGIFIPHLKAPRGRTMILPYLEESVNVENQKVFLGAVEFNGGRVDATCLKSLKEFRLECNTPTWTFEFGDQLLEKKIFMPYGQNTSVVSYRLLRGKVLHLNLRPYFSCRKHDGHLGYPREWPFTVDIHGEGYEIKAFDGAPVVRMILKPSKEDFAENPNWIKDIYYRAEFFRGLDSVENLNSPGCFSFNLKENEEVFFLVSTEDWNLIKDDPSVLFEKEIARRKKLLQHLSGELTDQTLFSQLVLAADQFIILPDSRHDKNILSGQLSKDLRTVIAGYHWFTDWGRDTMISLEGLTLCTGRKEEARAILQTFGHYVKNGLLPNHFPEGHQEAIYNTVDATFWYFHAIDRYLQHTNDVETLRLLYPILNSMIDCHIKGTDFGIHMDPKDHLIIASAEGCQLTWMDAKVDEWVVTPRRGKPVEIQALWFNALKLMESWSHLLNKESQRFADLAQKVYTSFNSRFWYEKGYLFDVIDTPKGNDSSLRPNQIISMSLRFPILNQDQWKSVVDIIETKLLTPFGLRTLDPAHKDYHGHYEGSRWERDAAYHQGLVWTWLMGHFIDAWQKVYNDSDKTTDFLKPFEGHLKDAGIGTISEIFDGDYPYHSRGCIAQAWSVAEVLRCFVKVSSDKQNASLRSEASVNRGPH